MFSWLVGGGYISELVFDCFVVVVKMNNCESRLLPIIFRVPDFHFSTYFSRKSRILLRYGGSSTSNYKLLGKNLLMYNK